MGREGKAWMPGMQEWTSGLGTGMIWGGAGDQAGRKTIAQDALGTEP